MAIDKISLNGEWTLRFGRQKWSAAEMDDPDIPEDWTSVVATVPGNVELDMVRAGILPEDLEKGHNIYSLRELESNQWWYSKHFDLTKDDIDGQVELVLEGVDTLATIWLNGQRLGSVANMLIPHRIDVSNVVREGRNSLVIGIDSTVLAAHEQPVEPGCWAMENNWESLSIRKAAHSFGWDIMPRAVSAGLWRDVYLETVPATRFRDVYVATASVDRANRTADIFLRWDVASEVWPIDDSSIRMTVSSTSGDLIHESTQPVLTPHGVIQAKLEDVDLWWPRGYGEPALYDLKLALVDGDDSVQADWKTRSGFRTIELELTETTNASGDGEFCFVVNGEKIFAKGSNWVPLDAFHSRDATHLDETFDLVVDLNCNMIRCWGGNVYESDAFFQRCDEAGVMVWQDFSFACALYPQTPEFHEKVRKEAETIIPLLRNHPSIALWAGNNEIDAFYTFLKPGSDPNVDDKISREVLASACRRLDPVRHYLPSSPYLGPELWKMGAPHESRPEDHLWGPRDDFKGTYYVSSNAHFASEMGYHGCPSRSSLERMMNPESLWPWQDNEEWLTHAVRPQPRGRAYDFRIPLMAHQIEVLFGTVPEELDSFVIASQISQAEALKFFIERFRCDKGRRTGILWWNVRDGWPQISDAVVDYYGSRKLAYRVIQRVQHDVSVMLAEPEAGSHDLVAVNDTLRAREVRVQVRERERDLFDEWITLPANGRVSLGSVPASAVPTFYRISWADGGDVSRNHYIAGPRPFDLDVCRGWYADEGLLDA